MKLKNQNGAVKPVIIGVIVLVLIVAAGLIVYNIVGNSNSPKAVTEKALKSLKALDMETFRTCVKIEEDDSFDNMEDADESTRALLDSLNYQVLSQDISGDKATVKVNIEKIDFQVLMSKAFEIQFSDMEISEDELMKQALEASKEDLAKGDFDLNLEKINGDWKLVGDDNFSQAILGMDLDY